MWILMYFDFLSRFFFSIYRTHTLSLCVNVCVFVCAMCVYVYARSLIQTKYASYFLIYFFTLAPISKCNKIKRKSSTFFFAFSLSILEYEQMCTYMYTYISPLSIYCICHCMRFKLRLYSWFFLTEFHNYEFDFEFFSFFLSLCQKQLYVRKSSKRCENECVQWQPGTIWFHLIASDLSFLMVFRRRSFFPRWNLIAWTFIPFL